MNALLGLILKALGDFFARLISDANRDRALESKGRAEGAVELNRTIAEAADEQAKINAADRGGADDVLERLRKRIEPPVDSGAGRGKSDPRPGVPDPNA